MLIFLNFHSQTDSKFNDAYHVVGENDAFYKCLTKNEKINLEVVADVKSSISSNFLHPMFRIKSKLSLFIFLFSAQRSTKRSM